MFWGTSTNINVRPGGSAGSEALASHSIEKEDRPLEHSMSVLERLYTLEANPDPLLMAGFGSRYMHPHTPLFWLPLEIMSEILHLHFISNRDGRYHRRLQDVSRVCFAWYILIRRTPRFWCFVSDQMTEYWVKKSSRPVFEEYPSAHRVCWLELGLGGVRMVPKVLGSRHGPHAFRWQSLTLGNTSLYPFDRLRGCTAPPLQELVVGKLTRPETNTLPDDFAGDNSNLRQVVLVAVAMQWSFNDLRVLDLQRISSNGPTLGQLAAAMASSPLLHHLRLHEVVICPEPASNHTVVMLSSLIHLSLVDIEVEIMDSILNLITGCVCDTLKLSEQSSDPPRYSSLFSSCPSYISDSIIKLENNSTSVKIQLGWQTVTIKLEGKEVSPTDNHNASSGSTRTGWSDAMEYCSEICIPVASHLDTLSYFRELRLHHSRVRMTIGSPLTNGEIYQLLKIRTVECLCVGSGSDISASELLRLLSHPEIELDGTSEWPLCHLKELEFVGETFVTAQQVLDMVEARYHHVDFKDVEFASGVNEDWSTGGNT